MLQDGPFLRGPKNGAAGQVQTLAKGSGRITSHNHPRGAARCTTHLRLGGGMPQCATQLAESLICTTKV